LPSRAAWRTILAMVNAFFFGYGSLVNRATHAYSKASHARLRGWRRVWRSTPKRRLAYLAAEPVAEGHIDGLIAHVPHGDWAALDQREEAYERRIVTDAVGHSQTGAPEIHVYWIPASASAEPSALLPLSYLDVVVQGYLHEYGEAGAADFFSSTAGWDLTVIDDRAAPLYPRAQVLAAAETALVDHWMQTLGLHVSSA